MALFDGGDMIVSVGGVAVVGAQKCSVKVSKALLESYVKGQSGPTRDYGHSDCEITSDYVVNLAATGVATVMTAFVNDTKAAISVSIGIGTITGNFLIPELSYAGDDGSHASCASSWKIDGDFTFTPA